MSDERFAIKYLAMKGHAYRASTWIIGLFVALILIIVFCGLFGGIPESRHKPATRIKSTEAAPHHHAK